MDYQAYLKTTGKYEEPAKKVEPKAEPKKEIDWEQRRYEIAKEIYAECILEYSAGDETRVQGGAWLAVTAADILIEELKTTSK